MIAIDAPGLFYDHEIHPLRAGLEWRTQPGKAKGKAYFLYDQGKYTEWYVQHCGHPTALYPYYLVAPDSKAYIARHGRGFSNLKSAQAALIQHLYEPNRRSSPNP